jgi:hypothetical protein
LLATPAHAAIITEGTIEAFAFDTFASFSGANFGVLLGYGVGFAASVSDGSVWLAEFTQNTLSIGGTSHGFAAVDAALGQCQSTNDETIACGFVTLTSNTRGPISPFTAAGHLDVGPGLDIMGRGTMEVFPCVSESSPCIRWTFSVPEPETAVLLLTSALALAGLMIGRMRAAK